MTPSNQPSQAVNPAQALLTMMMSNPPLTTLTDAQVDAVVSDLLAEIAALDLQHNKGKTIRPDQLDEQLFGRSRTFKDDRAALPYLRYNLRAAHEEFASLVSELRNAKSGILTAASLMQFSAIFTDYLFDLREILVPLQKNITGWTFFAGAKSFVNSSWEVFNLARSLSIQSAWSSTGIHLDHKASQIASILVLRQAMELRFERLISVYPRDAKGNAPKLRHGFHQDFITTNPQFFDTGTLSIKQLRHLYDWCSEIVHQAYQPYAWQIAMAMRRGGELLGSRPTAPNASWSIYNTVEIIGVTAMQTAYETHFLSTYGHGTWRMTRGKPEASVPNWKPEMAFTAADFRPVLNQPTVCRRIKATLIRCLNRIC